MAAVMPTVVDGGSFLQRAGGLAAGTEARAAPSECSFVEPPLATLASTVAELLTDHPELAAYASAFDDAKIKPALAASLSDNNYEKLLPDAPLGHVLELRQIFTEATRPRARLPQQAGLQVSGRMITNGVRENNLASKIMLCQEINVIGSSLMFSVSLPVLLNLPEECADGSTCYTLRTINAMLWLLLTFSFLCSVTFSWVVLTNLPSVADTHIGRWSEDHMVRRPHYMYLQGMPAALEFAF